jgi:hypothetical protein
MDLVDRRNPYVVLGIPFGASRDEASAAFAQRARGLRRTSDGAKILPDLTWALNQIDEVLKKPELALGVYRVPANPAALIPDGSGVLNPPPAQLDRRTHASKTDRAALLSQVGEEAVAGIRADIASRAELPHR